MLPHDGMHAIDLGAIVRLIMAILLKYLECVEKILDMEGLAASRLEARMVQCLARQAGPDGQTCVNMYYMLKRAYISVIQILQILHILTLYTFFTGCLINITV